MKTRMGWDWVEDWPVFVYTTFIAQVRGRENLNRFQVKVILGERGDQNSPNVDTSPKAEAYFKYETMEFCSKREVIKDALEKTKWWLIQEGKLP